MEEDEDDEEDDDEDEDDPEELFFAGDFSASLFDPFELCVLGSRPAETKAGTEAEKGSEVEMGSTLTTFEGGSGPEAVKTFR